MQCRLHGFDAVGVDRAAPRVKNSIVQIRTSLEEVQGDFDAITLFETLEHLDQPAEVLKSLSMRLRPGGILILETPDCEGVSGVSDRREYLLAHPLEHINCFTNSTMTSIAEKHGFKKLAKPNVHVAYSPMRIVKDFAKKALGRLDSSTQLYFRKVA